ncbi:MAG: MOSC domain-containing protein [Pseudobdellovibrionaceae bacterium]
MKIKSLHFYPVKGLRGIDLSEMQMTLLGPAYDREWIVATPEGKFVTQRTHPQMAQIQTAIMGESLKLSVNGSSIQIPFDEPDKNAYTEVTVFTSKINGLDQGREASQWLSDFFGETVKLFKYSEQSKRFVPEKYTGRADVETRFTDSRPILVVSVESLLELNRELSEPIPINRFRANIVLEGGIAWGEDTYSALDLGVVRINNAGPCSRCKVTTVDQQKGVVTGPEPLGTLSRIRKKDGKVYFGCYYYPTAEGKIRVGDTVRVLDT